MHFNFSEGHDRQQNFKKHVSIYWKCCHVFSRVYFCKKKASYFGHCPRCRKTLSLPVAPNGTHRRTFIAE